MVNIEAFLFIPVLLRDLTKKSVQSLLVWINKWAVWLIKEREGVTIEKKRLHYIYRHCLWVREEQIHWSPLYIYQKYLKLFIWRFKKPCVHSPGLKFMFWNRGVFVLLAWPLVIGQVQMFTNTLVDCPDLILALDGVHKLGDIQSLKKDLFISNWKGDLGFGSWRLRYLPSARSSYSDHLDRFFK